MYWSHVRKGCLDLGKFIERFQVGKHFLNPDGQSHIGHTGEDVIHCLVQSRGRRRAGILHINNGHLLEFQAPEHHLAANAMLAGQHALNTISVPDAPDGALIPLIAETCVFHGFPDGARAHGFICSGHFADRDHPRADDIHFFFHGFSPMMFNERTGSFALLEKAKS